MWEEAVLARLVALNAERRERELGGEVAWLRPEWQVLRFGRLGAAGVAGADLLGAVESPDEKAAWPKEGRSRVLAIKGVLAEAAAPTPASEVAARFKGRSVRAEVVSLLDALQRDGQVRRIEAGYVLAKAA